MFFRLLLESFARQKRRKALAAIAILLGTTAVTAMLALATTIGDRIHRELAVYGANIVVTPRAAGLAVNLGGVSVTPASQDAVLHEADLARLRGIFWANNITGVSPELTLPSRAMTGPDTGVFAELVGLWFDHPFSNTLVTGAPALHPWWKIQGSWPRTEDEVVVGSHLAARLGVRIRDAVALRPYADANREEQPPTRFLVSGIATTGDATDDRILSTLPLAQRLASLPGAVSRVDITARTRPEDVFARQDPDQLSPAKREIWYCRPYANSIAYQIREAIPGADAQQVRRVEQTEGTVLARISGLMWLVSAAALVAAGFAVSAAMATAVMERQGEIGLMRSLGASRFAIALLFYTESALLAIAAGSVGYLAGSALAWGLGARIFSTAHDPAGAMLNWVLLPVVLGLAAAVAISGSTPSIRKALTMDPSQVLRGVA